MAGKNVKMSAEALEKLKQELEYLETVRRAEIAEKLKEARGFGDLSENAEYDEAKNEQGILEAKITELQQTIENAVVIDGSSLTNDEVGSYSVVKFFDMELEEEETVQIVGSIESDPDNGKISDESPIGKALMGKRVGEIAEVEAPAGLLQLKILEISR